MHLLRSTISILIQPHSQWVHTTEALPPVYPLPIHLGYQNCFHLFLGVPCHCWQPSFPFNFYVCSKIQSLQSLSTLNRSVIIALVVSPFRSQERHSSCHIQETFPLSPIISSEDPLIALKPGQIILLFENCFGWKLKVMEHSLPLPMSFPPNQSHHLGLQLPCTCTMCRLIPLGLVYPQYICTYVHITTVHFSHQCMVSLHLNICPTISGRGYLCTNPIM